MDISESENSRNILTRLDSLSFSRSTPLVLQIICIDCMSVTDDIDNACQDNTDFQFANVNLQTQKIYCGNDVLQKQRIKFISTIW